MVEAEADSCNETESANCACHSRRWHLFNAGCRASSPLHSFCRGAISKAEDGDQPGHKVAEASHLTLLIPVERKDEKSLKSLGMLDARTAARYVCDSWWMQSGILVVYLKSGF